MAGNIKSRRAEIENRGSEILFAQVFNSPKFFDLSSDGGAVINGDVKFFDGDDFYADTKLVIETQSIVSVPEFVGREENKKCKQRQIAPAYIRILGCFRKLIFFNCVFARFLLFHVEPHYFNEVLF
jgi:hypothetical protein